MDVRVLILHVFRFWCILGVLVSLLLGVSFCGHGCFRCGWCDRSEVRLGAAV